MKLFVCFAALAATMFAQDAKVSSAPASPAPAQTERLLTTEEGLKVENSILRISLAEQKYKLAEYRTEIAPDMATQEEVLSAACLSVGVPKAELKTNCGIAGFGPDGKQAIDKDGKPIPRKVWYAKPQLVNAAEVLKPNQEKK